MEITTTRGAGAAVDTMPVCRECGATMVVRAQWHNGHVQGLNWVCRRAPGCEGVRRIRNPDEIRPINHDASTQAIFDWQSMHEARVPRRDAEGATESKLGGPFVRVLSRPTDRTSDYDEPTPVRGPMGYFDALV